MIDGSMADIKYARSFLCEWSKMGDRGALFIGIAAESQYRNLKFLLSERRRTGRVPTWCSLADYCTSVRMLRRWVRENRKNHDRYR